MPLGYSQTVLAANRNLCSWQRSLSDSPTRLQKWMPPGAEPPALKVSASSSGVFSMAAAAAATGWLADDAVSNSASVASAASLSPCSVAT